MGVFYKLYLKLKLKFLLAFHKEFVDQDTIKAINDINNSGDYDNAEILELE